MNLALTTRVRAGGYALLLLALLAAAPFAAAQNPTGTLTGTVTDPSGAALPGVTVTATSANLPGARIAQTGQNGDYKLAFLPPGDYQVTFELDGFSTTNQQVKVSAAVGNRSDIVLQIGQIEDVIQVIGSAGEISQGSENATTVTGAEIEKLAIGRNLNQAVQLAPGVHATGPNNNVTIAGALSYENLWTINGVVINENLRGQELDLFIEDSIQETTTQVSGVSAEFGRFQGGVINAITRSGGNEFSGSLR
ncbi:MAG TPA: carboxypeptidase regulatory-like domain-containing protein, partial [Thermoanaerobaculia bacterium]|nr:carboxypeptidase regulatory-like domain-containing protein [Thermoanaerobaculia bacterium]